MNAAETHHRTDTELIPGKKHAPAHLGRVLVVGLGKSGKAAVEYCAVLLGDRVESLTVSAGKRNPDAEAFVASYEGSAIDFRFEYEDIRGHFDLCIVSPGVPDISGLYASAKAASDDMVSELEFAWRESDADSIWIAITDTNGKTTTTSLATHLCVSAGMRAHAVGNIGEVALTQVWKSPVDVYVAEISSFQLATTRLFAPDAAVLLNITPDHIAWHGSMERYIEAKARIFACLDDAARAGKHPTAILDFTNDIVRELGESWIARGADARIIRLLAPCESADGLRNCAFRAEGSLWVAGEEPLRLCAADDLQIAGPHNVLNALAAAAAALAVGADPGVVARALTTFAPLEHRIEPCGASCGISFYNDSKGTNVDATLVAVGAFAPRPVVCLLGGHDKGTDLTPLVQACRAACRAVVCFGEAAARFLEAFGAPADLEPGTFLEAGGIRVAAAEHLKDATLLGFALAEEGDVLLLSPACSSFDEFTGYEERGRVFKDFVRDELGAHVG